MKSWFILLAIFLCGGLASGTSAKNRPTGYQSEAEKAEAAGKDDNDQRSSPPPGDAFWTTVPPDSDEGGHEKSDHVTKHPSLRLPGFHFLEQQLGDIFRLPKSTHISTIWRNDPEPPTIPGKPGQEHWSLFPKAPLQGLSDFFSKNLFHFYGGHQHKHQS